MNKGKEPLTKNVSNRICEHMNNDHKDSLISIAKKFGGAAKPSQVKMIEINSNGMILEIDARLVEIHFDHALSDSSDAHQTLVQMTKSSNKIE